MTTTQDNKPAAYTASPCVSSINTVRVLAVITAYRLAQPVFLCGDRSGTSIHLKYRHACQPHTLVSSSRQVRSSLLLCGLGIAGWDGTHPSWTSKLYDKCRRSDLLSLRCRLSSCWILKTSSRIFSSSCRASSSSRSLVCTSPSLASSRSCASFCTWDICLPKSSLACMRACIIRRIDRCKYSVQVRRPLAATPRRCSSDTPMLQQQRHPDVVATKDCSRLLAEGERTSNRQAKSLRSADGKQPAESRGRIAGRANGPRGVAGCGCPVK